MDATRCNRKGDCQEGLECLTHHLWLDLSDQIHNFLSDITLNALIERREIQATAARQDERANSRIDLLLSSEGSN